MTDHQDTPPKNHNPDLGKLAQDYMDLWQQQLSSMAADKDLASLMTQTVQLMNTGTAEMAQMANQAAKVGTPPPAGNGTHHDDPSSPPDAQHATSCQPDNGTPSACPACGVDEHVISVLDQRIDELEARIATLERPPGKTRR
jgi:hypothetical protein